MTKLTVIKKRKEYLFVSANCTKKVFPEFIILYQKAPELNQIRVGFTATKKLGGAVIRNKCKRIMRALIREATKSYDSSPNSMRIVLIARHRILETKFCKMLDRLKTFFNQLKENNGSNR